VGDSWLTIGTTHLAAHPRKIRTRILHWDTV